MKLKIHSIILTFLHAEVRCSAAANHPEDGQWYLKNKDKQINKIQTLINKNKKPFDGISVLETEAMYWQIYNNLSDKYL